MTLLFRVGATITVLATAFLLIRYRGLGVPLDGLAAVTVTVMLASLALALTADTIQYRRWKRRNTES